MSIIKSIKQVLGLSGTASENHFWDGSVPNQLSLRRGTPDAPGAELIKALNGALSFPNQGQSLAANGYVKLPGGLIIQWGTMSGTYGLSSLYPIPFPNMCMNATATFVSKSAGSLVGICPQITDLSDKTQIQGYLLNGDGQGTTICTYIAVGY